MVWEYLFDNEHKQRDDINLALAEADITQSNMASFAQNLAESQSRVAKLELTLEALIRLLEHQRKLSREDLAVMVQRLDLADGVEDGMMGPDRSAKAPKCSSCGRPVNQRRSTCIYCSAPVVAEKEQRPAPRMIQCARCNTSVPEVDTYITERGAVCPTCYRGG